VYIIALRNAVMDRLVAQPYLDLDAYARELKDSCVAPRIPKPEEILHVNSRHAPDKPAADATDTPLWEVVDTCT
jgi:hypothetical protein